MKTPGQPAVEMDEPRFLVDWQTPNAGKRRLSAGAASLLTHVIALIALAFMPASTPSPLVAPGIVAEFRRPAILVAPPPLEMTQRAPNRGKVGKEFDLESLRPRPPVRATPPPAPAPRQQVPEPQRRVLEPPPAASRPAPAPNIPQPPKIEAPEIKVAQTPPMLGTSPEAPPAPPSEANTEHPKLAFETPGSYSGVRQRQGAQTARLAPPRASVDEAVRGVVRSGRLGAVVVGDAEESLGGFGGGLPAPAAPGKVASSLELLSDPMGVDFRPYLVKILATVRRNWMAVIPESAKLGRRGKVQLQFAIARDGSVPKLVIAMPSGADALDRAAVAGVSASNPFPPLPNEFRGAEIRLQFTFLYNIK